MPYAVSLPTLKADAATAAKTIRSIAIWSTSLERKGALEKCFLKKPVPEKFEDLLLRTYQAPHYGKDGLFGSFESAAGLALLAKRQLGKGKSQRVKGDLSVSPHRKGSESSPYFWHGDLTVDGKLDLDEGAWMIVTGNLTVGDVFVDDYHGSQLVVGGTMTVGRMTTMGGVVVLGDLKVKDGIVADGNDASLWVAGTLTAPIVVTNYHNIDATKEKCRRVVTHNQHETAKKRELRELFVDSVFDMEFEPETPEDDDAAHSLDITKLRVAFAAGKNVFRAAKKAAPAKKAKAAAAKKAKAAVPKKAAKKAAPKKKTKR